MENMIYETLRKLEGGGGDRYLEVNTIAVDQLLYQFVNGVLKRIGSDGKDEVANFEEMKKNNTEKTYKPTYKW